MVSPVTPVPTINNPPNFSPQQSDPNSEINQASAPNPPSSQPTESPKEEAQAKTEEAASTVFKEEGWIHYVNQAKALYTSLEQEYKQMFPTIVAIKQPFWFIDSLKKAYQSYQGTAPVDPLLEKRKALQEAIEKIDKPEEFIETLVNKVENRNLLSEPLPNGQLPLNYTIFKGNLTAMRVLLGFGCNMEQRDFQSQTALDIAYVTKNEEVQAMLKDVLIGQQQRQLLNSIKGKEDQIDKEKLAKVFQDIEAGVEKVLRERVIVDPLTLSSNDKLACIFAILWLGQQVFSGAAMMKNEYVANYLLPGLAVMSQVSEMRHVWENAGHLPALLYSGIHMCAMVPSLQSIYKPFKVGMIGLSMLNTLKVTADNYRLRGWASATKLAVNSINFYHFLTYNPPAQQEPKCEPTPPPVKGNKAFCDVIKKNLVLLHPDKESEDPSISLDDRNEATILLNMLRDNHCQRSKN